MSQFFRYVSTGSVCVVSLYMPGPNTSATWPSLTNTAICDSRTVSEAPFWISISAIGKRQASVPSPDSVHWMMSMNCFLMKSIRAMVVPLEMLSVCVPAAHIATGP
ncbi:hypothetical protein D9M69_561180 [compost metagenome]